MPRPPPMSKRLASVTQRILARLENSSPDLRRAAADRTARHLEEITYRRLAERGFRPDAIIDVGAFEGNWTKLTQEIFGATPALMVEAQEAKEPILKQVFGALPKTSFVIAALGEESGQELEFHEMGTGSSLRPEHSNVERTTRKVITRTLDEVVGEALPGHDKMFLKIDVQGAELDVLRGGAQTLGRCELVQLEIAMLEYNEGAPLMPEVVAFMAERDFLPIEVSGFSRPRDILVQIDLIFARAGSALRPREFLF